MAKFDTDEKNLYIDGKRVLRGWESFSGWYWFATEKAGDPMSDLGDGKPVKDTIYKRLGLVESQRLLTFFRPDSPLRTGVLPFL